MSKDIRSFFTVLSSSKSQSKSTPTQSSKKRAKAIESSDDEVLPETPDPPKKKGKVAKKRKINVLSSDSEDESSSKSKKQPSTKTKKETKTTLKPVSILETFGNEPIKQAKVPEKPKSPEKPVEKPSVNSKKKNKKQKERITEIGTHNDADFEKTLLDLDDDFLMDNVDELDKTIDEALSNGIAMGKAKESSETVEGKGNIKQNKEKQIDIVKTSPKESPHKKKGGSSSEDAKTPSRKRTVEHYDGDPDQERYEKKRQSAILYQKYLNRSGPAHHGSKEIPKGKPDCLKNLCFIRTGVLDSLENEEFDSLIKEHGGRTVHSISKKVNYVVVGEDPGPAKLEKAKNYGIKVLSEDELLDLIKVKSGMQPGYTNNDDAETVVGSEEKRANSNNKKLPQDVDKSTTNSKESNSHKLKSDSKKPLNGKSETTKDVEAKVRKDFYNKDENAKVTIEKKSSAHTEIKSKPSSSTKIEPNSSSLTKLEPKPSSTKIKPKPSSTKIEPKPSSSTITHGQPLPKHLEVKEENLPWTEKYKPTNIKAIIGQQTEKSNMKRLITWLQNWYKNHSGKNRPKLVKPSPWAKSDDGSYFKAALLSGPPGIGKTTTATLVAKDLGFDVVEFNASDTRNKRLLHEEVSQLLSTKSLAGFFTDGSAPTNKHVLLMDEVDGMAGNEDRGGIQELISLIKDSNVPIVCMCNDRNSPKVRSLANYCLDLRFSRPRLEQIRGAMMSVCFKENVKITPDALTEVINGAGMDIRQILTHLSVWSTGEKVLSAETASKEAKAAKKDTPLGPWEVCRKVFSAEEHKTASVADRARLFYHDYSIAPLFVQENYLKVLPHAPKKEHLKRFAYAADAISMGDLIDSNIRRNQNWSLLDVEAMCASVLPGHYVEGHMNAQIDFPSWLGKNSKKNKFNRLLSELQAHMRTSISGSRSAVNLDYVAHLRNGIVKPLAKDGLGGLNEALNVMHAYNLLREDLDSILELAQWPRQKDPMNMVDSKVKAAFTRAYNKEGAKLPYAVQAAPIKKRGGTSNNDEQYEEDEGVESGPEEDDDVNKDAMIKAKKPSNRSSKKETEPSAGTSKRGAKGGGSRAGTKKPKK